MKERHALVIGNNVKWPLCYCYCLVRFKACMHMVQGTLYMYLSIVIDALYGTMTFSSCFSLIGSRFGRFHREFSVSVASCSSR